LFSGQSGRAVEPASPEAFPCHHLLDGAGAYAKPGLPTAPERDADNKIKRAKTQIAPAASSVRAEKPG
jgi:hypothetical protein